MNSKLRKNRKILVLAPHLVYPTRNGADILIDRRWREVSRYGLEVYLVGQDCLTVYSTGQLKGQTSFNNQARSKIAAGLRTLLYQSHYLYEKFITRSYLNKVNALAGEGDFDLLVCSFIWTAALKPALPLPEQIPVLIETHNDEIKWFQNLRQTTTNPLRGAAAAISERWVRAFFKSLPENFLLIHLTTEDHQGYQALAADHRYLLAPIGMETPVVDLQNHDQVPSDGKIRLLFVGALGVQMNLDALEFFRERFYPALVERFGDELEIHVAGSTPANSVRRLCQEQGWVLYPDLTDSELAEVYQGSDFSILPFPYTTGAKLKLLNSIAHCLPFLATTNLGHQLDLDIPGCLFSDDPGGWASHIAGARESGNQPASREQMRQFQRENSWQAVTADFVQDLKDQFPDLISDSLQEE